MMVMYSFKTHMPSFPIVFALFPDLFMAAPLAIALLRVVLALYFLGLVARDVYAWLHVKPLHTHEHSYVTLHRTALCVTGVLLLLGLFTQGAALAGAALMVVSLERGFRDVREAPLRYLVALLAVVSLTLVFLGPGAFAVDMPL